MASLLLGGCAIARPERDAVTAPVVRPMGKADLSLDEIPGAPHLGAPRVVASPRPPIAALLLYAQAREAQLDSQTAESIPLLERVVALDPDSFEPRVALARACRGDSEFDVRAIQQYEQAAELEPDHLDVQLELAHQYLGRGDKGAALLRLRLAIQTAAYKTGEARAAEADLLLGNTLAALGYDRAALTAYQRLLGRLAERGPARSETARQVTAKFLEIIGDLYVRRGQVEKALAAYEKAQSQSGDLELQNRIVRALLVLHRGDDAKTRAGEAVEQFGGSPESVALLRDVHRILGGESGAIEQLARMHARRPQDLPVMLGLAQALGADRRWPEARRLLMLAAQRFPDSANVLRRRVELNEAMGDPPAAARAIIEMTAQRPELTIEARDLWTHLLRTHDRDRFDLSAMGRLSVSAQAQGAKAYALWQAASMWPRRSVARTALAHALAARPPFAPAYRAGLEEIWSDPGRPPGARASASEQLAMDAERGGNVSLAAELRGRALLAQGDLAGGAAALADAVKLSHTPSAELRLALAQALLVVEDGPGFEKLIRQVLQERPAFADAAAALYDYCTGHHDSEGARRVLRNWSQADPRGLSFRLLLARDFAARHLFPDAEKVYQALLREYGDDKQVLSGLEGLMSRDERIEQFAAQLEDLLVREPRSFNAAEQLVRVYLALNRTDDAVRVLNAARCAAIAEPDVLYDLSGLYLRAGQQEMAEQVLRQVLRLDPSHFSASRELGSLWAQRGRHLDQAEMLLRTAMRVAPDDPSLLDSLGWVLYKRGRLDEAQHVLERAVQSDLPGTLAKHQDHFRQADAPAPADPVALDHLGDVMYRLCEHGAAMWYWSRSLLRFQELGDAAHARSDLQGLEPELRHKLEQLSCGQPVSVGPIAGPERRESTSATQAAK